VKSTKGYDREKARCLKSLRGDVRLWVHPIRPKANRPKIFYRKQFEISLKLYLTLGIYFPSNIVSLALGIFFLSVQWLSAYWGDPSTLPHRKPQCNRTILYDTTNSSKNGQGVQIRNARTSLDKNVRVYLKLECGLKPL